MAANWFGMLLFAAILVYALDAVRRGFDTGDVSRGVWLPVYLGALLLVSHLGAKAFGGTHSIRGPWDSVVVAAIGAVTYVAGVISSAAHLREHPSTEYEPELASAFSGPEDAHSPGSSD